MKKLILLLSLSMLVIAFPVFGGPDLTGTWCVSMSSAFSQGTTGASGFFEEEYEIEFIAQEDGAAYGTLFYGQVNVGSEYTYFSGVLDGNTISMTHWDSVTRGILLKQKKNKPLEINFINNAFDAKDRSGKTSIGIAVKGHCPQP